MKIVLAKMRGLEVNRNKVSFMAVLGDSDGGLITISQEGFFKILKKARRQIRHICELENCDCKLELIDSRKIRFLSLC